MYEINTREEIANQCRLSLDLVSQNNITPLEKILSLLKDFGKIEKPDPATITFIGLF